MSGIPEIPPQRTMSQGTPPQGEGTSCQTCPSKLGAGKVMEIAEQAVRELENKETEIEQIRDTFEKTRENLLDEIRRRDEEIRNLRRQIQVLSGGK